MAQARSNLGKRTLSFLARGIIGAIIGAIIVTILTGLNFLDLIISQVKAGWTRDASDLLLVFAGIGAIIGFLILSLFGDPDTGSKRGYSTQSVKVKKSPPILLLVLRKILTGILAIISCTAIGGIMLAGIVLFLFAHYRPSYFTIESFKAALIANTELAIVTASIGAAIGFLVGIVVAIMGKSTGDVLNKIW